MADIAESAAVFAVTAWLLTCLVHTTVLSGSAWVVIRLLSLPPETQNALWKAALIGGIATATIVTSTAPVEPPATLEGVRHIRWTVVDGPVEMRSASMARVVDPTPTRWWPMGLMVLWLSGVVCGAGAQRSRGRGLRVVRASLRPAGPRAQRLFGELRRRSAATGLSEAARGRIARSRLFVSSMVGGPCVLPGGILVLSDRCEAELTDAELRAAVAHEMAHVGRGDLVWACIARWTGVLLWLQPLGRLVRSRLSSTSEVLCDEWAVRVTGERYGLASSIARVAEWATSAAGPAWGLAMVGHGQRTLSDRVRRILHPASGRVEPPWLTALVVVVLVSPLCWLPMTAPSRPPTNLLFEQFEEVDVVRTGDHTAGERRIMVARLRSTDGKGHVLLQRGLTPILAGR